MNTFTGVFVEAEEGGYFAYAEEIPGANTQGETLAEARTNLKEAIELVIETNRELAARELADGRIIKKQIQVATRQRTK